MKQTMTNIFHLERWAPSAITIITIPDTFRTGNFEVNNSLLKLSYSDGEISVFFIEENELIPINENMSISIDKMREKWFAKRLKM
jgi:hypothetical protein